MCTDPWEVFLICVLERTLISVSVFSRTIADAACFPEHGSGTNVVQIFASSSSRNSYENDALCAQIDNKQLIYVTGTGHSDHVKQITDLAHWHITIKGRTFSGTPLVNQLLRHKSIYPNVSFIFVDDQSMCQTIWNLISKCNP